MLRVCTIHVVRCVVVGNGRLMVIYVIRVLGSFLAGMMILSMLWFGFY
jgi:hypothetical protein